MSMFLAAMAKELRDNGRIGGLGGMSSEVWRMEIEEHEAKLRNMREEAALSHARTGSEGK